jgi:hypothetical protein
MFFAAARKANVQFEPIGAGKIRRCAIKCDQCRGLYCQTLLEIDGLESRALESDSPMLGGDRQPD